MLQHSFPLTVIENQIIYGDGVNSLSFTDIFSSLNLHGFSTGEKANDQIEVAHIVQTGNEFLPSHTSLSGLGAGGLSGGFVSLRHPRRQHSGHAPRIPEVRDK